ncbi:DNA topoisomerase I, partial [Klebsiella pneumoniae]|nr:DNA topoisomerase I [Klebsiella pneumoniae]
SGYPDCDTTLPAAGGKPGKRNPRQVADKPCPKCGKELVRRYKAGAGKKGYDFWSCSGYPSCDAKFDNVGGKPKI